MSGDDSSLSLRAPARETVFRPFPLASPSGALYIERMFFLRRCMMSINQFTIFVSIDPYIPTGYEPGLNALPIRNLSIIEPADVCTRLASAPHPCTLVFKPQLLRALLPSFSSPTKIRTFCNMESTKFTCKHGSTEMLNDRNYHCQPTPF